MAFLRQLRSLKIFKAEKVNSSFYCTGATGGSAPCESGSSKDAGAGLVLGLHRCEDQCSDYSFKLTKKASEKFAAHEQNLIKFFKENLPCDFGVGKVLTFNNAPGLEEYAVTAVSGIGDPNHNVDVLENINLNVEYSKIATGLGVQEVLNSGLSNVVLDGMHEGCEVMTFAAAHMASFQYNRGPCPLLSSKPTPLITGLCETSVEAEVGTAHGRAQNLARYFTSLPPNLRTPFQFVQEVLDCLCDIQVHVEVHDSEWLKKHMFDAFMAATKGSCEEPYLLEVTFNGCRTDSPPVLVVASGVTFDSGGLCLKTRKGMIESQESIAPAAVAIATVAALQLEQKYMNYDFTMKTIVLIPVGENMIGARGLKVGDVVRAANGNSILVEDTSSAGQMMMADTLVYGQSTYKPSIVLTMSCLDSGTGKATAGAAFGCFTNSDFLWKLLEGAGAEVGDRPWRFPLFKYYDKRIKNDAAVDLRNRGFGTAAPCMNAAFIRNFICGDFAHLDISGLAHAYNGSYLAEGLMTGRPTLALARTIIDFAKHCNRQQVSKLQNA